MFGEKNKAIDWWRTVNKNEEIVEILIEQKKFDKNFWRNFHCLCCRRVWPHLREEAKEAVEVAECVLNGGFTDETEATNALSAVHHRLLEKRSLSYGRLREFLDQIPYELRSLYSSESHLWKLERGIDLGNESKRLPREFQQLNETYIQECITYASLTSGLDACEPNYNYPNPVIGPTKVLAWATTMERATGELNDKGLVPEQFFGIYYEVHRSEQQAQFQLLRSLVANKKIDWWKTIKEPYKIGEILIDQNMFDQETWRTFHCLCCRRVWPYIHEEAKEGIEVAEQVLSGAFADENEAQHALATVLRRLKEKQHNCFKRLRAMEKFLPEKIAHKKEAYIQANIEYSSFSCGINACQSVYNYAVAAGGPYNLLAWSETSNRALKNRRNRSLSIERFLKVFYEIISSEKQEQIKLIRKLLEG